MLTKFKEDVTAPGTGLGMSIVKQIVDLSGGRIDVRSEQNRGTEIKLSLPLENCMPETPELEDSATSYPISKHEDPIDAVRRRAQGRTVSIHGFDSLCEKSDLQIGALASLKASIEKYVTKWFDLRLVSTGEIADIVVSDESAHLSSPVSESRFKILLILCSNGARRDIYPPQLETGQIVEFVSMPCGPHRLAKAMLNCLDNEEGSTPLERVSLQEPHNGEVSPEDAMTTAGTSNSRLIGNLQSSIGFSPTIINQIRVPGIQTTEEQGRITRPSLSKRTSSAAEMPQMQIPSSGSTSTNISEESSNYETPETSTSDLGTPTPSKSISSTIERRPKMLLVEVSLHLLGSKGNLC
jgi:hypothetical protein